MLHNVAVTDKREAPTLIKLMPIVRSKKEGGLSRIVISVGRDEKNDVNLRSVTLPLSVSRFHAKFYYDADNEFSVEDDFSTNGTFVRAPARAPQDPKTPSRRARATRRQVNDRMISPGEPRKLVEGDIVSFGGIDRVRR